MIAWLKVIGLGLTKWPLKFVAMFVVPFLDDVDRVTHPVFGVRDATDLSWKNIGWRNSVHNLYTRPQVPFETKSNTPDHTLERIRGFQWRYRYSVVERPGSFDVPDGKYVSFRMTWGKPKPKKGKNEFYIGWTMNEKDYMRLTFFQFRPVLLLVGIIVWLAVIGRIAWQYLA